MGSYSHSFLMLIFHFWGHYKGKTNDFWYKIASLVTGDYFRPPILHSGALCCVTEVLLPKARLWCPGSDRRCCHCQLSARPRCLLVWADMFGGGVPGNYEKSGPENGKIVIVPLITHAGDTDMQLVFYCMEQRSRKCLLAYFPCWDAARKCCKFYSGTSQKWFGGCGG